MFGKRTEVKDAFDHYANIEVAYLLSKLDELDGVAILATNFCKNVDDAFLRRMHDVAEVPASTDNSRDRLLQRLKTGVRPRSENSAQWCPLWCLIQGHLPSPKVAYAVTNAPLNVCLGYLRLRWIVKSVH